MRRQIARQIDAASIDEPDTVRDRNELRRIAMLGYANARCCSGGSGRHGSSFLVQAVAQLTLANGSQTPVMGSSTGNVPLNKLHVTLLNMLGAKDPATGGPFSTFGTVDSTDASKGITSPGELTPLRA
jgi:hypothetical protein